MEVNEGKNRAFPFPAISSACRGIIIGTGLFLSCLSIILDPAGPFMLGSLGLSFMPLFFVEKGFLGRISVIPSFKLYKVMTGIAWYMKLHRNRTPLVHFELPRSLVQ